MRKATAQPASTTNQRSTRQVLVPSPPPNHRPLLRTSCPQDSGLAAGAPSARMDGGAPLAGAAGGGSKTHGGPPGVVTSTVDWAAVAGEVRRAREEVHPCSYTGAVSQLNASDRGNPPSEFRTTRSRWSELLTRNPERSIIIDPIVDPQGRLSLIPLPGLRVSFLCSDWCVPEKHDVWCNFARKILFF